MIERTYCLICGREIPTESGHVCRKCLADTEAANARR